MPSCRLSYCLGSEQQAISTELLWWSKDTASALPDLRGIQRLIHGDAVRSQALLQTNSAAAVRRNILATQQLLASLPGSGVSLLLLSSHRAAERRGSTLAAAEALVAQWAASQSSIHQPGHSQLALPRRPGCANGWLRL